MYEDMIRVKRLQAMKDQMKRGLRKSIKMMNVDTKKAREETKFQEEVEAYLQPKIDVARSLKNQQIMFMKSPGIRHDEQGENLTRQMIGNKEMMDRAVELKDEKQKKNQGGAQSL